MGGKAFLESIPDASFSRMSPETYYRLKTHYIGLLETLYRMVGVPREAPGKESHGDLDFVVCEPLHGTVRTEDLKTVLSATHCIEDSQPVKLAVQIEGDGTKFCQVDVNVCQDGDEWRQFMFFHGYGDLGMILGVLARNNGLALGLHGLKVPHHGSTPPFFLSADFERILAFYKLSYREWEAGFASVQEIFEWVATSWLFDAREFKESARRKHRRDDRKMYQAFLRWVEEKQAVAGKASRSPNNLVKEALTFFGKQAAYAGGVEQSSRQRRLKEALNGKLVMEWTGVSGPGVRTIMDALRASMDEETILRLTREEMRSRVLQTRVSCEP